MLIHRHLPLIRPPPGEDSAAGDIAPAADAGDEDTAEIEVLFGHFNKIPADVDMVEEAINEITRKKLIQKSI